MQARVLFGALLFALLSSTAEGEASETAVPSAWAGIWSVRDTTFDCYGGISRTSTWLDTLCTGEQVDTSIKTPYGVFYNPQCSGPGFTDTALDLSCFVSFPTCSGGYNCVFSNTIEWARNGDVATTSYYYSWQYVIDVHHPILGCSRTTGVRTRIAGGAAACGAVPVQRRSWGTLKLLYR